MLSALPAAITRDTAAGERGGAGKQPVAAGGDDFATVLGRAEGQAEAENGAPPGPATSQAQAQAQNPQDRAEAMGKASAPSVAGMATQALPRVVAMPDGAPAIPASVSGEGLRTPGSAFAKGAPETTPIASPALPSGDAALGAAHPGQDDAAPPAATKGAVRPAPSGESGTAMAEDSVPVSGDAPEERESPVAGATPEATRAPDAASPPGIPVAAPTASPTGMAQAPVSTVSPAPQQAGSVTAEPGAAPSQATGQSIGQSNATTSRAAGAARSAQAGKTLAFPDRTLAERREAGEREVTIRDAPAHPTDAPAEAGGDKAPASPTGAAQGTFPGSPVTLAAPDIATNAGPAMPGSPSATEVSGAASTLPPSPTPASPQPAGQASAARPLPPPPAGQIAPVVVGLGLGTGAEGRVEVVLEPAELGRVAIRLERDSGKARLHVQAERPETLALLQRDGAELNRALSQAGLAPEGGLSMSFSLSGGDSGGGTRRDGASGPPMPTLAATDAGTGIPATARLAARGLLDIAI
ncbi:Flagellar hook-length control protein FliK [Roseomonas mucosa]|uniref:Flagellar hook-length control protein FliK n=2 Tax=Roseomonas mucosa TaxID=207340 RepID=A0A4Y1MWE3_9PROT|nr:Flagellar hook-length control protein FliK [Roseomonas mucosa]